MREEIGGHEFLWEFVLRESGKRSKIDLNLDGDLFSK